MRTENLSVLILGYGAREHALAWKVAQSPRVGHIFIAPGNAGTASLTGDPSRLSGKAISTNVPISDEDVDGLVQFARQNQIDLTVVGTNDPLALGVVDAFQAAGLAIFGPNQAAAQLESSKSFAKGFMRRHEIPTAAYASFTDYEEAVAYVNGHINGRLVVKISGLGKMGMGVTICDNRAQAKAALHSYMVDKLLGDSANTVIIEERIEGPEVSVFALSDGKTAVPLMAVRDHKRVFDGDKGPNTGGIGAFGPPPDLVAGFIDEVMTNIMQPTVDGMAAEGNPYVGVLFAGIMLTKDGMQLLEFNCRFGNPEALVMMALLESDLVEAMLACINGRLTPAHVKIKDETAVAIMMSSGGYPAEYFPVGLPINGTESVNRMQDIDIFHHGTTHQNGQLVTSRGRVLAVTAVASTLPLALSRAYEGIAKIHFTGAHYRKDIGLYRHLPKPQATQVKQSNCKNIPVHMPLLEYSI